MDMKRFEEFPEMGALIGRNARLDRERQDALSRGDSVKYARLCLDLGIQPEDRLTFWQGFQQLRENFSQDENSYSNSHNLDTKESRYKFFHDGASELVGTAPDFGFYDKLDWLTVFPRFRHGGKQPVYDSNGNPNYSPAETYVIFQRVYKQSEKAISGIKRRAA